MFGVLHTDGSATNNPPLESLSALYDELATAPPDAGEVAVINDDTGWCLGAYRDGRVVFEHLGLRGKERHMMPVSKDRVLELWQRLVIGDIDGLLAEPWTPGYQ